MIQQHVLYWLCTDIANSTVAIGLGAMGGLAAPLFVTLAGVGSSLALKRHCQIECLMPLRGLIILCFGYLLNFLTPSWFSLGAWYVLHLIGFAVMISPFLQKIPSKALLVLMTVVIFSTALLQTNLETPLRLFNQQMGNPINLGGFFRHMFVEGFFPIFPWIAYFMAGIVAGRWILQKKIKKISVLAAVLFSIFIILAVCFFFKLPFTRNIYLIRFFVVTPSFYPSSTPMILLLISLSLFFLSGVTILEAKVSYENLKFLSYLGQSSMTLLIIHVFIIRGSAHYFGFWRIFPMPTAVMLTWATLLFFTIMVYSWQKTNYRYGAEWLMRKVSSWSLAAS
jgi:uncharacterized membrane protein